MKGAPAKTVTAGFLTAGREKVLLASLLGILFLQEFCSARLLNNSYDEAMHLPSGYTYWKTGDFRLNTEHPPLIKLIAAAPLLLMNPDVLWDDPTWKNDPPDQARFGIRFLYLNDADLLLFWGRLPVMLLSVLLGWYVFRWARDLYGSRAGLAALFLYAFCPNILAHSRFVTMDLGLSGFLLITAYYLWRFTRLGSLRNLVAAGVALGLALATKFSAVILIPSVLVLLAMAALQRRSGGTSSAPARLADFPAAETRGKRLVLAGQAFSLMLVIAFFLVWAIYFFPGDPLFYVRGIRQVNLNHAREYWPYLAGNFRRGGWWYYFLAVFFLKTPPPTLILFFLSLALVKVPPAPRFRNEGFLLVPGVVFFVFTSSLADNVGVRYILPVYPLVCVFAARLTDFLFQQRARVALAVVLGAWLAFGTIRMYPDYLAYFTDFTGGAKNGHKYLDDSNIDWGTDLKRLKVWMDKNGIPKIRLYSPWNALPGYYGIPFERFNFMQPNKPPPGIYAISTQSLIRGKLAASAEGMNTDWLVRYKPIARVGYGFYIFKFE